MSQNAATKPNTGDQPEKMALRSHDIAAERVAELLRLFPEIRTEGGKLDFDRLKLALGEAVDVGRERYGMNWPGKADCFKTIQTPSMGTLRPCPEESVNWDTTKNLIIEGDNLEVLKLLQKSYLGKIKMIYIDPPYNTGNDFIYPDNYSESLQTYLEYTVQADAEGKRFSLFFIDRVGNYRDYGPDGQPGKGKFAIEFETALAELAKDERFKDIEWLKLPVEKLHNGYFSQDKKGIAKDTRGDTQADDDTYSLIMKEKERLLSVDEPLRFIFTHSALREGWDNPNVFQICTLNETASAIKKRQEIGRGLRLPVDASGRRVFDESINRLYVMANESYEDFAKALQKEYAEDCGVTFGRVPMTALSKLSRIIDDQPAAIGREAADQIRQSLVQQGFLDSDGKIQPKFDPKSPSFKVELPEGYKSLTSAVTDLLASYQIEQHIQRERDEKPNRLRKEVVLTPEFKALWERIKPKTTYRVEFETEELIRRAVQAIKLKMPRIEKPKISVQTGGVQVKRGGVTTTAIGAAVELVEQSHRPIPDVLAYLQNETELTRSTIFRVLKESGRLDEFFNNPQRFMDEVANILKYELHRLLVDGIKYERIRGSGPAAEWEQMLFKNEELVNYLSAVKVSKSVYEYVVYDSDVERKFAEQLDQREDIKLFVKLPGWFEIDTPIGKYNPDWAILKYDGQALYLVRETKGTRDFLKLRTSEADKVRCGQKHFEALGLPFAVVVSADEV